MTASRQLKLGAFMRPASLHTGAWRYPGAFPDANFNFAHLKRFAQKLEHGSSSLALDMTDAANAVAKVPFVGSEVRTPFDKAAGTATDMAGSGHDLATGLGRFAVLLGVLIGYLAITLPAGALLGLLERKVAIAR